MADNKKYYYLKLKENFYDSEEMILLQNMPDGYLYSDILMKLYLRSLKNNGKLMYKDVIPYTPSVLAQVVRHQVGTVEKALSIFKKLGLVEILDTGAIYMMDIQNFIGESSTEADRKRVYREKIKQEKYEIGQKVDKCLDKCTDKSTPEIEIEIEIDIEKEKKNIKKKKYGMYKRVLLTEKEYNKLVADYGKELIDNQIELLDEYVESNNNKNKYTNFNLVLRKSLRENWFYSQKTDKKPAWFDKKLEIDKISSEDEINEMEELLRGLTGE